MSKVVLLFIVWVLSGVVFSACESSAVMRMRSERAASNVAVYADSLVYCVIVTQTYGNPVPAVSCVSRDPVTGGEP